MIVRDETDSFLLITQPDHARLAADIVAAMQTEVTLEGSGRDITLLATREHDNGWIEVDASPTIEPATGRPCDFIAGPAHVKHELWPRGVARVAKMDPRAGALVAQHAITVYSYRADDAEWAGFFGAIASMRDDLLRQLGAIDGPARDTFDRDYRCVRLGDLFSLQFCNGWSGPLKAYEYEVTLRGSTLVISPDPFNGGSVTLRVMARRLPRGRYATDGELQRAFAHAVPEWVSGTATGG
jgi:hypothetical protein